VESEPKEITSTVWILLWQSIVLMPFFLLTSSLIIAVGLARFIIPILIIISVGYGLWLEAGAYTCLCILQWGQATSK